MSNLQKGVLDKVEHFLDKKKISYEVIIVDDGSTDGSIEFIREFVKENNKFHLIENPHYGKAGTVTTGMLAAKGEYVLFTDMDQATPIEELDNLMPYFDNGYDIVIGSRSQKRKGAPLTRVIMARGAMILRRVIIGVAGISDTQCGFKIFKRDVAQKLFKGIKKLHHGFHQIKGSNVTAGFDMELLYIATQLGYKIKEVPVRWLYVETRRVNPVVDSVEGVVDLLRIKKNTLTGKYKNI